MTLALREPAKMPPVTPFAQQTIAVAPGIATALHFMLPREVDPMLEITVQVHQ